jgi:hypothetical protein
MKRSKLSSFVYVYLKKAMKINHKPQNILRITILSHLYIYIYLVLCRLFFNLCCIDCPLYIFVSCLGCAVVSCLVCTVVVLLNVLLSSYV